MPVVGVLVSVGCGSRSHQFELTSGRVAHSFRILVTSEQSGLIETITDAVSIHSIKKDAYARTAADGKQVFESFTLFDYYVDVRTSRNILQCSHADTLLTSRRNTVHPTRQVSAKHKTPFANRSHRIRSSATCCSSRIATTATFSSTHTVISFVRLGAGAFCACAGD